jgi:hypothetical protein
MKSANKARRCDDCTKDVNKLSSDRKPEFMVTALDGETVAGRCLQADCLCNGFEWNGEVDWISRPLCGCGHAKHGKSINEVYHATPYVLFTVGQDSLYHTDGSAIQGCEVFTHLWNYFESHPTRMVYVGFWLQLDFCNWLNWLPWHRLAALLKYGDSAYMSRHGFKPIRDVKVINKAKLEGEEIPEDEKGEFVWKKGPNAHKGEPSPVQVTPPPGAKCPVPIKDGGTKWQWQIDIMDNLKRFRLRIQPCGCQHLTNCEHVKDTSWMYICDVGSMFQGSLLNIIAQLDDPRITPEMRDIIERGKANREDATLDDSMILYNQTENQCLEILIDVLNTGLESPDLDIHLGRKDWYSPGVAAGRWMRSRAPKSSDLYKAFPQALIDSARMSYMAGWWFNSFIGKIDLDLTDLKSSYPARYTTLLCLGKKMDDEFVLHVKTEYVNFTLGTEYPDHLILKKGRTPDKHELAFVHAHVKGSDEFIGAMLHRDSRGRISRPHQTAGWYEYEELMASKKAGLIDEIVILEAWIITPNCNCQPPMKDINHLYALRDEHGHNSAIGKAAKLISNSVSGKTAQTVGSDHDNDIFPEFLNWIYASLITADTRRKICNAIETHPDGSKAVGCIFTDSVGWLTPHPYLNPDVNPDTEPPYDHLRISQKIGYWDHDPLKGVTMVKPGWWWPEKSITQAKEFEQGLNVTIKAKTRGANVRAASVVIPQISETLDCWEGPESTVDKWPDSQGWPYWTFNTGFTFLTLKMAVHLGRSDDYGNDSGLVYFPDLTLTTRSNIDVKSNLGFYDEGLKIYRVVPKDVDNHSNDCCMCPLYMDMLIEMETLLMADHEFTESELDRLEELQDMVSSLYYHSNPYMPQFGPSQLAAKGRTLGDSLGMGRDGSKNSIVRTLSE